MALSATGERRCIIKPTYPLPVVTSTANVIRRVGVYVCVCTICFVLSFFLKIRISSLFWIS